MSSIALQRFDHAIQDAVDLQDHFDSLNKHAPSPKNEVLKRACVVMLLAALESYFEDRLVEAVDALCEKSGAASNLTGFLKNSLATDLKTFHTPSTDRVRPLFQKYLGLDVTEGWLWNNVDPAGAKAELNRLAKKRGDIAHRSWRPIDGQPQKHAVTRDELRRHLHFVRQIALATDAHLQAELPADKKPVPTKK